MFNDLVINFKDTPSNNIEDNLHAYNEYYLFMKEKVKCYPATIYERVGYSCNQCECTAGRKSIVSNHVVVVHQRNRHNCNQCS